VTPRVETWNFWCAVALYASSRQAAEQFYADLTAAGVEVLYDDPTESAGVKFNDADLIGLPLRAVVSKRSLKKGGIELKLSSQKESRIVPLEDAIQVIQQEHP
jgi:prolyl-tRNA synthetase